MAVFFFFDNMRYNLIVYFSILTIVIELLGNERFGPKILKPKPATIIQAPIGDISGVQMSTKYGRSIHAYKGKKNCRLKQLC